MNACSRVNWGDEGLCLGVSGFLIPDVVGQLDVLEPGAVYSSTAVEAEFSSHYITENYNS